MMRRLLVVFAAVMAVLALSCGIILSPNGIDRYPLESQLRFHIGPSMAWKGKTELLIWANQPNPVACSILDADFSISLDVRKIIIDVDGIISSGNPCSGIYPPLMSWPFPELPPGRYTLTLKINYPGDLGVKDIYTVDIIDGNDLTVTTVSADSSEYSLYYLWES